LAKKVPVPFIERPEAKALFDRRRGIRDFAIMPSMRSFDKRAVAAIAVLSAFLLASTELRAADRLCVAERGKSSGYRIVLPDNPRPSDTCAAEARFPVTRLPDGVHFAFDPDFHTSSPLATNLSIKVDGVRRDARSIRVSAHPFNRVWPGHQRPIDQSEPAAYLAFEQNGPAAFEIRPARPCTNVVVRPLSAGVKATVRDGSATFVLPKPGYYSVEFDGTHHALHVFMDPLRDFPERARATRTYGPGVHVAGVVKVVSGDRIYIDRDAIVYGSFQGEGVKDVRIFGGGVIDGSVCERIFEGCYPRLQPHGIHFYESSGIEIDGPVVLNSACWCVAFFDCEDVSVSRVKVVGQWRYNTDGIDICNSRRVTVRDCFVRAFDDVISIKGIYPHMSKPVEDITVERCVLWCGWGNTCEPGVETFAPRFRRIRFEDCDLIHNAGIALDVACGGPARVEDLTYRNLRVELQDDTEPMILQTSEAQKYDAKGEKGRPELLAIRNKPWGKDGGGGSVDRIVVENVQVFADPGVPPPVVRVRTDKDRFGRVPDFGSVRISGLTVNGRPAVLGVDVILKRTVVLFMRRASSSPLRGFGKRIGSVCPGRSALASCRELRQAFWSGVRAHANTAPASSEVSGRRPRSPRPSAVVSCR